ncbi:MAG: restriction endonuclease [Sphingobium sp.]|nr:restriction endonuclease [Sphingobium sp.]
MLLDKPERLIPFGVVLSLLYVLANNASEVAAFFASAVLLLMTGGIAYWTYCRAKRRAGRQRLEAQLIELIDRHENALVSYYHQCRRKDLFGNCDESRWHDCIDLFLKSQLVPDEADFRTWRQSAIGRWAAQVVAEATAEKVALYRTTNPLTRVDASSLTPLEYERHCADLLRVEGWKIQETPATRDGGADFVAEKEKVRLVVQCKRYSQPVGNKAVQEVTAAVRLYGGNVACVVAPTGFTKQAQQEATGLSVHLLHHSMLAAFAEKLAA